MTKQQLLDRTDDILRDRREQARRDLRARQTAALQNPEYAQAMQRLNACRNELARAQAFGSDPQDAQTRLDALQARYDEIVARLGLDLDPHPQCPHCGDSGFVDNDRPCACRKRIYQRLLQSSCRLGSLPAFTFADNRIADLRVPQSDHLSKVYAFAARFCQRFDTTRIRSILLSGNVGVGKTALLAAIANDLIARGNTVCYLSAFEFHELILARHTGKLQRDSALYDSLFTADLLMLDDLGTEPIYRNVTLEYLLHIVERRIADAKPIVVSTNLTPESFCARYGERIYSRLANKSYAVVTPYLEGDDLRKFQSR